MTGQFTAALTNRFSPPLNVRRASASAGLLPILSPPPLKAGTTCENAKGGILIDRDGDLPERRTIEIGHFRAQRTPGFAQEVFA